MIKQNSKKNLSSYCFSSDFLSLKNDLPSKCNMQKNFLKNVFGPPDPLVSGLDPSIILLISSKIVRKALILTVL
jgi:hypothetical protein